MRCLIVLWSCVSAVALASCGPRPVPNPGPGQSTEAAVTEAGFPAPAGLYKLDPSHASLIFRASHLGFSFYTGSFATFDAVLSFTPDDPGAMEVSASIDVSSLVVPTPPEGFVAALLGEAWFNTGAHPEIHFQSTSITQTGPRLARVDGVLTFLGTRAPLSFEAEFVGGYPGFLPYDPQARIGFTASGSLHRSDFGMTGGLPPEGSNMGVADAVSFRIDAEFLGPPTPEAD